MRARPSVGLVANFSSTSDEIDPDDYALHLHSLKLRQPLQAPFAPESKLPPKKYLSSSSEIINYLSGLDRPTRRDDRSCFKREEASLPESFLNSFPNRYWKNNISCSLEGYHGKLGQLFSKTFMEERGYGRIVIDSFLFCLFSKLEGDTDRRAKLLLVYAAVSDIISFWSFCEGMSDIKGISDEAVVGFLEKRFKFEKSVLIYDFGELLKNEQQDDEFYEAICRFTDVNHNILFVSPTSDGFDQRSCLVARINVKAFMPLI